jgi:hypothetical protein
MTPELAEYLDALGRPGVNQEDAEAAYITALYHKALGAKTESEKASYHKALEGRAAFTEQRAFEEGERAKYAEEAMPEPPAKSDDAA